MTNDSELESLQCYPFHLPELPERKPKALLLFSGITEADWQKALGDSEEWERLMRRGTRVELLGGEDGTGNG